MQLLSLDGGAALNLSTWGFIEFMDLFEQCNGKSKVNQNILKLNRRYNNNYTMILESQGKENCEQGSDKCIDLF